MRTTTTRDVQCQYRVGQMYNRQCEQQAATEAGPTGTGGTLKVCAYHSARFNWYKPLKKAS